MRVARTPDERFANLPGFPFDPRYVEIPDGAAGTLRVHYLDEGPASADPVLLMHGEPSWSYLYRKMIPVLIAAGHRCVAPDLVGFGRSDKPTERGDYTYANHVAWVKALLEAIDLEGITLFCQDWGGLIGLRLAAENPERFSRIVAANTGLPTGDGTPSEAFLNWRKLSQEMQEEVEPSNTEEPTPFDTFSRDDMKAYLRDNGVPFKENATGATLKKLCLGVMDEIAGENKAA